MNRKIVSGLILTALLAGMLILAFDIQPLKANGTITIRSDGSIGPPDGRIVTDDLVHYYFTQNIMYDTIVVNRDNIVIDGAGYTLEGSPQFYEGEIGIELDHRTNVNITNLEAKKWTIGIDIWSSSFCTISRTNITLTTEIGIYLDGSSNTLFENTVSFGQTGICLFGSSHVLSRNNITGNYVGIQCLGAAGSNNLFSENLLANNNLGMELDGSSNNTLSVNIISGNPSTFNEGIILYESSNNILTGNTLSHASIKLEHSSNNVLSENYCSDGYIWIRESSRNTISDNTLEYCGISLYNQSNDNVLSWNNIKESPHSGIDVDDNSANNTLSGNTVTKNYVNGICVCSSSNTLRDNTATENKNTGILIIGAEQVRTYNTVSGNTVMNNEEGIFIFNSSENILTDNLVINNYCGIQLDSSEGCGEFYGTNFNTLCDNIVANNSIGIITIGRYTSYNRVYHNVFINNDVQASRNHQNAFCTPEYDEGNYWSDYEGIDEDDDRIGDTDTPHYGDAYPLICPPKPIPVFLQETTYYCNIDNSITVSRFSMDENRTLSFNINGQGHVNLTVSEELIDGSIKAFVNGAPKPCILSWNETHHSVYFEHSTSQPLNVKIEAKFKLVGDWNGDCQVNIRDIFIVAKNFGKTLED